METREDDEVRRSALAERIGAVGLARCRVGSDERRTDDEVTARTNASVTRRRRRARERTENPRRAFLETIERRRIRNAEVARSVERLAGGQGGARLVEQRLREVGGGPEAW